MTPVTPANEHAPDRNLVIGMAALVGLAYAQGNLGVVWTQLLNRVTADPTDAAALMDMSTILLTTGQTDEGLALQESALQLQRHYHLRHGRGDGLKVLAFMTAGDLMANTPVEFLLEGSDVDLWMVYVDAQTPDLLNVPEHDVAFVAVAESESNRAALGHLKHLLSGWNGPILNGAPERIAALTRDGVSRMFAREPSIVAPAAVRTDRKTLQLLADGLIELSMLLPLAAFPIIVRPVGSHAGHGMEKIGNCSELAIYVRDRTQHHFYLAPFVQYGGADGLYRKQRIAFINGRAYASHWATSENWMVHYLSAGMTENAARRAEEESWMRDFDSDFAVRHAVAFDALCRHVGLDYFAIDCAEMPDGRLLLFEVDVAMIVHAMDPEAIFPYKKPAMRKLFDAFQGALRQSCDRMTGRIGTTCAHTGRPAVYQRSTDDCMVCVLAMLTGRTYEDVIAAALTCNPSFQVQGPMSHSVMRGVANNWGFVLLSSIYVLWEHPAIVGVLSPTTPNTGHAVFWDGEKIIDPGRSGRVDRNYVNRHALEFTQRAHDLQALVAHERQLVPAARSFCSGEPF